MEGVERRGKGSGRSGKGKDSGSGGGVGKRNSGEDKVMVKGESVRSRGKVREQRLRDRRE